MDADLFSVPAPAPDRFTPQATGLIMRRAYGAMPSAG
jgi:hypothetical protein